MSEHNQLYCHANMSPSVESLKLLTTEFFSRHWNELIIGLPFPVWSERYEFIGSLPNYDKQGVYAFVTQEGEVTYVGVGTSRGSGRYRGHGLGARFQAYSQVVNDAHSPTDSRLKEADGIITIGFSIDFAYIANALELFLLSRLRPRYNYNMPCC